SRRRHTRFSRDWSSDVCSSDLSHYTTVLERYARPDNPLFVAETGNRPEYARYFFAALGRQAIGWSPFGIDFSKYSNYPLGAKVVDAETLEPFALDRKSTRLNSSHVKI